MIRKHYALPAEHGAWIWLLGPFVLGAAAGGSLTPKLVWLLLAGLAAFLSRQPASIIVKVLSSRRGRRQLWPAVFWFVLYSIAALLLLAPLLAGGYQHILLLALPGIPVFTWHLWLVKQRAERKRPGVEIVAAGVLSLMAPAAFWVAGGASDILALALWGISWLQSAASIVHIHLRLIQREQAEVGSANERLKQGWRSLAYHTFNLFAGLAGVIWFDLPTLIPLAFGLVFLDSLHGVLVPATGYRPARIGVRQLFFSSAFFLISASSLWRL